MIITFKELKMSRKMQSFIKENRAEITKRIFKLNPDLIGHVKTMNDDERKIMILNEPELTDWARSQGVVIS